jgi:hypothetical protein
MKQLDLTEKEVRDMCSKYDFDTADKNSARIIHNLCALMWSYAEAPYFVAHDIAIEKHGMYSQAGVNIFIRDHFNLKPTELWSECGRFPYTELRIVCVYSKDYSVGMDFYGNQYSKKGNPRDCLQRYYVEADGKKIQLSDILRIIEVASEIIKSISKQVYSLKPKVMAKKYADIFWYRKKPLADALGRDWKPKAQVYAEIEKGEIGPVETKTRSKADVLKMLDLF